MIQCVSHYEQHRSRPSMWYTPATAAPTQGRLSFTSESFAERQASLSKQVEMES